MACSAVLYLDGVANSEAARGGRAQRVLLCLGDRLLDGTAASTTRRLWYMSREGREGVVACVSGGGIGSLDMQSVHMQLHAHTTQSHKPTAR